MLKLAQSKKRQSDDDEIFKKSFEEISKVKPQFKSSDMTYYVPMGHPRTSLPFKYHLMAKPCLGPVDRGHGLVPKRKVQNETLGR